MNKKANLYGALVIVIGVLSLISTQMNFVKLLIVDNNTWDYYGRTSVYARGIDKTGIVTMITLYVLPIILIIFGGLILTGKVLQSSRVWLPMLGVAGLVMAVYAIYEPLSKWGSDADSSIMFGGYLCLASYLATVFVPFSKAYPKKES